MIMNQSLSCVFVSGRRNHCNLNKCLFSEEIKLKYRFTRTFDKLTYFLQSLEGSGYNDELPLNERNR